MAAAVDHRVKVIITLVPKFDNFPGYENLGNDNPFYFMKTVEEARQFIEDELPYKPDFIKIGFIVPEKNKESVARSYMPR